MTTAQVFMNEVSRPERRGRFHDPGYQSSGGSGCGGWPCAWCNGKLPPMQPRVTIRPARPRVDTEAPRGTQRDRVIAVTCFHFQSRQIISLYTLVWAPTSGSVPFPLRGSPLNLHACQEEPNSVQGTEKQHRHNRPRRETHNRSRVLEALLGRPRALRDTRGRIVRTASVCQ
jgi:hypothetical protein